MPAWAWILILGIVWWFIGKWFNAESDEVIKRARRRNIFITLMVLVLVLFLFRLYGSTLGMFVTMALMDRGVEAGERSVINPGPGTEKLAAYTLLVIMSVIFLAWVVTGPAIKKDV